MSVFFEWFSKSKIFLLDVCLMCWIYEFSRFFNKAVRRGWKEQFNFAFFITMGLEVSAGLNCISFSHFFLELFSILFAQEGNKIFIGPNFFVIF